MSVDDKDVVGWMTVKGNHIPIRKGQNKEQAMLAFLSQADSKTLFNHKANSTGQTNKQSAPKENAKKENVAYATTKDTLPFADNKRSASSNPSNLTKKEFAIWYKKIAEIERGGYVDRSPSGDMYILIDNKIAITSGTYVKPELKETIEFENEDAMFDGLQELKGNKHDRK